MVFQAIEFQLRYTLRHSRNVDGGVFALGIQIAAPLSQFAPILPGRKLRAFFLWYSESLALTQVECWEFVPSRYFMTSAPRFRNLDRVIAGFCPI